MKDLTILLNSKILTEIKEKNSITVILNSIDDKFLTEAIDQNKIMTMKNSDKNLRKFKIEKRELVAQFSLKEIK